MRFFPVHQPIYFDGKGTDRTASQRGSEIRDVVCILLLGDTFVWFLRIVSILYTGEKRKPVFYCQGWRERQIRPCKYGLSHFPLALGTLLKNVILNKTMNINYTVCCPIVDIMHHVPVTILSTISSISNVRIGHIILYRTYGATFFELLFIFPCCERKVCFEHQWRRFNTSSNT